MPSLQTHLSDILFVLIINEEIFFFEKKMGVSEFMDVFPQVSLN